MDMKTFIKKAIKAFIPYGLIALRRNFLSKNQKPELPTFYDLYRIKVLKNRFLKNKCGEEREGHFDFNGAFMPDVSGDVELMRNLVDIFGDTFLFHHLFNDNYDKSIVEILDLFMPEGPYGYKDGSFDVTVHKGDVVIDAGAWCGDFSAYSASKGAVVYAFEPTSSTFTWLLKTAELNKDCGKIIPIKCGLGEKRENIDLFVGDTPLAGSNTIVPQRSKHLNFIENIEITTLDQFVIENNVEKVNFIKADIEGAERYMLKGAVNVLKEFSPKLAICTYHFPDDPEILEKIILDANPKYKIVHLKKKLFACVI
jgi:FkbM family methyltransferase